MKKEKSELIPTISLEHGEGEVVGAYLPMERMKREIPKHSNSLDRIRALENENKRLEEENKKLKADLMEDMKEITKLEKENKNLRAYADNLDSENDNQAIEIEELKKENKNLKKELELVRRNTRVNVETLDNMYGENVDLKKENKELQRENDKLKIHIEAKDKAYVDLLADYNYLKARIKKTERAFIKYKEKLEKLEVDLDMVVMNR